jgi:hypothetical protein
MLIIERLWLSSLFIVLISVDPNSFLRLAEI